MNTEALMKLEQRGIFRRRVSPVMLCLCSMPLILAGCSAPTEVDRDNRRLLDAILTAITMKNVAWLEEDAALAEKRNAAGQLPDADYEELLLIIEKGRSGEWKTAEEQGYEFRKRHPYVKEGQ